ncbi:MAG: hypothetical protein GY852_01110 [bacterium]|nr:hypothetical protein [bacterium]
MALPKLEIKGSRFTLKGMIKELGERLGEALAPFKEKPPERDESGYRGAPGPIEWEDDVATGKPMIETGLEEVEVGAKKMFPEKKTTMDSKRMHKPKVRKPKVKRGKARGKLQKNL